MIAFFLCLFLTPLCRDLFLRLGIVDRPDQARKFHVGTIPRVGGIAIVVSYAGALGAMFLFAPHEERIHLQHSRLLLGLLLPAAIVFVTGLVDDLIGLKPWQKLSGQFVAASLAVSLGARLNLLHGFPATAWVTIPFSLIWLIGCTNAVNLIDGMDGLASGVGLLATLATLCAALMNGNVGLAMATVPLAGCLLAFLRYNFSPATIFLGDCGSLTIGFMLGCFGLIWSHHGGTLFGMTLPMMALALPLLDSLLSIGRRAMRSAPIFEGDRGHIHHMVLARGFRPHVAALILYAFCAVAALLALLQTFIDLKFRGPIFLVFGWIIWAGLNYLGYIEFQALGRIFSRKNLLGLLRHEISLQELRKSLDGAQTVDDFWEVIRIACTEMGFASVRMSLCNRSYNAVFETRSTQPALVMTLDLGHGGQLIVTRYDQQRQVGLLSFLNYIEDAALMNEPRLLKVLPFSDAA